MSTNSPRRRRGIPCPPSVTARNHRLDQLLESRWGLSVYLYKSIKALTDLAAVILAFYAIQAGLDPSTAVIFVAFVLGGWELVESLALREFELAEQQSGDSSDD